MPVLGNAVGPADPPPFSRTLIFPSLIFPPNPIPAPTPPYQKSAWFPVGSFITITPAFAPNWTAAPPDPPPLPKVTNFQALSRSAMKGTGDPPNGVCRSSMPGRGGNETLLLLLQRPELHLLQRLQV